jgi:hypothetical protein
MHPAAFENLVRVQGPNRQEANMRLTFVIAMAILFGLAAYAKLLAMAQSPTAPSYGPLQGVSPIHFPHSNAEQ